MALGGCGVLGVWVATLKMDSKDSGFIAGHTFACLPDGLHNPFLKPMEGYSRSRDDHVARFKMPLVHEDAAKQDGLAFLCVKSMLLTGFA